MKAAIIVFPGANCDRDMKVALRSCLGIDPIMHWHADPELPRVDLIVVPGGFSYGDYLRPGAMAARSPAIREMIRRAEAGLPVLGVCNGFQILTECRLLPGVLMRNAGLRFVCRPVDLRVENNRSIFTAGYRRKQVVRIPVAHNEGNYYANENTLDALEGENRIAFRYCDEAGAPAAAANPNGASRNIAGILNETGNVLGMMPHPERRIDPWLGGVDARPMFEALAAA